MYLEYWQLASKPFEPACSAEFLYRSAGRQSALHKLRYALDGGRAAVVLSGEPGVGKSLLVETLRQQLPTQFRPFVTISYPRLSEIELLTLLAEQIGAPAAAAPRHTTDEALRRLQFALGEFAKQDRRPVVVIDEAHVLEECGLFEPLRLLLNLTADGRPLFTLVLCGQLELLSATERHGALDDRIDLKAVLSPLSADETASYLQHRMTAAGAHREIFAADAAGAIHDLSGGSPRRINRLADLALLVGFANESDVVRAEQVHAVYDELIAATPKAA